jgi:FK506-binding nuclear protein
MDVEGINGEKKQVKKRKTNSGNKNVTIELEDNGDAKMNLDPGLDDLDDANDNHGKNSGTNEKTTNKKKTQIKQQQDKNNKKKDTNNSSKTNEEKSEAGLPKSPKPSNDKSPNSQEKKVKNVDGVSITETKVGKGKQAKNGKKVGVRYIGRLTANGKVFDSNTTGKPFFFTLGKAEVIKGWDVGINGMCVGGERKLVIPPAVAYGTKGHPPTIPKNATLEFEVKLLKVD